MTLNIYRALTLISSFHCRSLFGCLTLVVRSKVCMWQVLLQMLTRAAGCKLLPSPVYRYHISIGLKSEILPNDTFAFCFNAIYLDDVLCEHIQKEMFSFSGLQKSLGSQNVMKQCSVWFCPKMIWMVECC